MANDSDKPADVNINPHMVYGGFALLSLLLAVSAAYGPVGLRGLLNGPFGLFQNLTLLLCVVIYDGALKGILRERARGWKAWGPWAAVAFVTLLIVGEKFSWGIPYMAEDYKSWAFINLRGLLVVSFEGMPDKVSLNGVLAVAVVRMGALLLGIYAIIGIFYGWKRVRVYIGKIRNSAVVYGFTAAVWIVLALLMHMAVVPGKAALVPCFVMLSTAAMLIGVLEARQKKT